MSCRDNEAVATLRAPALTVRIVGVNPEVWAARRLRLTLDCWVGTKTYWGDSIVN